VRYISLTHHFDFLIEMVRYADGNATDCLHLC